VANVTALVARTTRERRHGYEFMSLFGSIVSTARHKCALFCCPFPYDLPASVWGFVGLLRLKPFLNRCGWHFYIAKDRDVLILFALAEDE